jgi:hypothetical protein
MLVIHYAQGVEKDEIRIPKNQGITGEVFSTGKMIRVNDCYSDERFYRGIDLITGYKTNNLLVAPLKDNDEITFGVIVCLNKINGLFTEDDEEILGLFSNHVSKILKKQKTIDNNENYISNLKQVISFKKKIINISIIKDFSNFIERSIMDILSVHYCNIFFYNETKNKLMKITKYVNIEKNLNIGIVGKVFSTRAFLGINSMDSSEIYNNLIDIETGMGILTYPILVNKYTEDETVKGILQFSYNEKLINMKKPKDCDDIIIKYILEEIEIWFEKNINLIEEFFLKN